MSDYFERALVDLAKHVFERRETATDKFQSKVNDLARNRFGHEAGTAIEALKHGVWELHQKLTAIDIIPSEVYDVEIDSSHVGDPQQVDHQ